MLQYNMIQRMSAGEEYEEDEDVDIELEEGAEELGQEKERQSLPFVSSCFLDDGWTARAKS
jgi:hypothetical protein